MSEFDILAAGARGMASQRAALERSARNLAAADAATPGHAGPQFADALTELVAMLGAQRAFQRSAALFDAGKHLVQRTLDVVRS